MRRVLTPGWWVVHLLVVAAVLVMLRLGLWQWHRANSASGGIQNYAYAFQWPVFAAFGVFLWARTLQEEVRRGPRGDDEPEAARRAMPDAEIIRQPGVRVGLRTTEVPVDEEDAEVAAWNARLAALNARTTAAESRKR